MIKEEEEEKLPFLRKEEGVLSNFYPCFFLTLRPRNFIKLTHSKYQSRTFPPIHGSA